jgi:N-acetylneuraminate synthase
MLVEESKNVSDALGIIKYDTNLTEEKSKQFRRSIYFVKDLQEGEIVTEESIRSIRPGYGLAPKYFLDVIGHSVKKLVRRGQPVTWDVLN